jgi:hypothetical protein
MATLYPLQDSWVRGEISPRLHARASLELYRAGLATCVNFLTLPHGGLRKRGGTYFVDEVKVSSEVNRLIPFVFSAEQAYALVFGNLQLRVYAYGARVGTVEVVTPWTSAELKDLQFYQSADVMWIAHRNHKLRILTRTAHTTWTLAEYPIYDGPYEDMDPKGTVMTPGDYGALSPPMTSNSAPSGTVASFEAGIFDAFRVFDKNGSSAVEFEFPYGWVSYQLASGTAVVDAYYVSIDGDNYATAKSPASWVVEGSNDGGASWTAIDTRTAETGWVGGETRFYYFYNETPFLTHRFHWKGNNGTEADNTRFSEIGFNRAAVSQTPFTLTASSTAGINGGSGFLSTDVGRSIRLQGSDGEWRWAEITSYVSATQVLIKLHGQALPDLSPISRWQMSAFKAGAYPEVVAVYEERLALAKRFSVYLSKSFDLDNFSPGEADDDGMSFTNAGGGQANDIVWIADADGSLLLATTGGVRALSGSGIDEALTPSSFKNRSSRTFGCAGIAPVNAGPSFLYVTRSRRSIAELQMNQFGRFTSDDIGQISEHIPKKGVNAIAWQENPDPILWFTLDNGELGGYTHQPAQEVRGMHRHRVGGTFFSEDWPFVESIAVTPGQDGMNDDVWLIVRRSMSGDPKRYIEMLTAPMEGGALSNSFAVDCGLSYYGPPTGTVTGLSHLDGQTVDVLAHNKVHKGLRVLDGSVTLPGGDIAANIHVGLPFSAEADTLELDVGAKDGSLLGRRKKVAKVILSLLDTDLSGLHIRSLQRGAWERVRIPSVVAPDGTVSFFTGNVEVPIDDSWEGMGKIQIIHDAPTPCTIRGATLVFDAEP